MPILFRVFWSQTSGGCSIMLLSIVVPILIVIAIVTWIARRKQQG
jgi:hypothetical protein